ncbi:MAG TPA: polyprenyl synthetase family protein, partial [Spirochaetia bacterium]|nr:polyprenyl synthetase family protein [Spirochaetia bacterium]
MKRSALLDTSRGLTEHLSQSKSEIGGYLREFLHRKRRDLERVGRWGSDVADRLAEFSDAGKMIRGSLVVLGSDLFGRPRDGEEMRVASAIELMQTSLLVHDDIMDRDETRRGMASVHSQYSRLGRSQSLGDPLHFGESMGICAGDVAIFTAFEMLGELEVPARTHAAIISLCSKEMTYVGVAQ